VRERAPGAVAERVGDRDEARQGVLRNVVEPNEVASRRQLEAVDHEPQIDVGGAQAPAGVIQHSLVWGRATDRCRLSRRGASFIRSLALPER
jgi:hypothetical protein